MLQLIYADHITIWEVFPYPPLGQRPDEGLSIAHWYPKETINQQLNQREYLVDVVNNLVKHEMVFGRTSGPEITRNVSTKCFNETHGETDTVRRNFKCDVKTIKKTAVLKWYQVVQRQEIFRVLGETYLLLRIRFIHILQKPFRWRALSC